MTFYFLFQYSSRIKVDIGGLDLVFIFFYIYKNLKLTFLKFLFFQTRLMNAGMVVLKSCICMLLQAPKPNFGMNYLDLHFQNSTFFFCKLNFMENSINI